MAILWGAEAAPGLYLVPQGHGTELLFILRRAQDRAWHWTQTRRAVRGHIPKYVHARVLAMSPGVLSHQLAITGASLKCKGARGGPAARLVGLCCLSEELGWRTIMRRLKLHRGVWGDLARAADNQLMMWKTGLLAAFRRPLGSNRCSSQSALSSAAQF